MFSMASSLLLPWLMQPGRLGHSATQKPSSPGYIMTCRLVSAQFYLILYLRLLINLLGIEAMARKKDVGGCFGKLK